LAGSGNGSVTISLEIAEVIFDGNAMDGISGSAAAGDITLAVEQVDSSTLSSEAQATVGDGPYLTSPLWPAARRYPISAARRPSSAP
jgi:hypothetical protein